MIDMNEIINGLVLTKTCTVSADSDAKKAGIFKTIHLRVTYDNVTLTDVFAKQLATTVIQCQTKWRESYESLVDGSTITVPFSAPTRVTVDPKAATKSWFATASPEERAAYIAELEGAKA